MNIRQGRKLNIAELYERKRRSTVPDRLDFEAGWGVVFNPHYHNLASDVIDFTTQGVEIIDDVATVKVGDYMYCAIDVFLREVVAAAEGFHDLRSRWFATQDDAREHERSTLERWRADPSPAKRFIIDPR